MNNEIMAEQAVIGAILADAKTVMPEAVTVLVPEDFQAEVNQKTFAVAAGLYNLGKPVDAVTILHGLGDDAQIKVYLVRCLEITPSASAIGGYLEAVKENSRRINATKKSQSLLVALMDGSALDACQSLAVEVSEALNTAEHGGTVSAGQGFVDFYATKMSRKTYIKTGIGTLDKYTYLDRGDYIIVGGRPSSGKTAFTLQMMLTMAQEHSVVYFSLETSSGKIFDRLVCAYTQTPMDEIKMQEIKDWGRIAQAHDCFSKLKFHVVEAAGWTVAQITAKAVQLRAEVIFVDYISLVKGDGKSLYERVTNISVALHTAAQQRKLCIVALSQLSRSGDGDPELTSLRESGQLEQDADVVLLIRSLEDGTRTLKISKNKEGKTGNVKLNFHGEYQSFREMMRE